MCSSNCLRKYAEKYIDGRIAEVRTDLSCSNYMFQWLQSCPSVFKWTLLGQAGGVGQHLSEGERFLPIISRC